VAISFVGTGENNATGVNAGITITLPTCQENDIVIVAFGATDNADRNLAVSTSGYAELTELYANATYDANFIVAWKRMGATPDTEVACTSDVGSASAGVVGIAYVLRGVNTTTAIDVTTTTATGTGSMTPDGPGITPVTAGALVVVCGYGAYVNDAAVTAPSGYSNHEQDTAGSTWGGFVAVASKAWSGSGEEDPAAWTDVLAASSGSWCAVTVALRPPVAITGTLDATESGDDTCSMTGIIIHSTGTLAATETGADTCDMAGVLGSVSVGTLAVTEIGADTCSMTGNVPISGTIAAIESGADTCAMVGEVVDYLSFTGSLAALEGDFSLAEASRFTGSLAALEGDFVLGTQFNCDLPGLTGKFYIEEEKTLSFTGKFAAFEGDFSLAFGYGGKLAALQGDFELFGTTDGISFDCFLAALEGDFSFYESTNITFTGSLPALRGDFFLYSTASTDFTTTSDEVIRHRR
jgi:hypothetical protein